MNLKITQNQSNDEIIVKLTSEDMARRLEGAVFDLIAVKLADKYVQEHGDFLLHNIIDVASLKEEVAISIKQRLIDETANKVQKQ